MVKSRNELTSPCTKVQLPMEAHQVLPGTLEVQGQFSSRKENILSAQGFGLGINKELDIGRPCKASFFGVFLLPDQSSEPTLGFEVAVAIHGP